jgi:hypothetical protein
MQLLEFSQVEQFSHLVVFEKTENHSYRAMLHVDYVFDVEFYSTFFIDFLVHFESFWWLLEPLHAQAIELGVINYFSSVSLISHEGLELIPCDLGLMLVVYLLDKHLHAPTVVRLRLIVPPTNTNRVHFMQTRAFIVVSRCGPKLFQAKFLILLFLLNFSLLQR